VTRERQSKRLTSCPPDLRRQGIIVGYRILREMAIDGCFPAHQINSIWHFYADDLGLIAKAAERHPTCISGIAA
jgi:hypothetical protein